MFGIFPFSSSSKYPTKILEFFLVENTGLVLTQSSFTESFSHAKESKNGNRWGNEAVDQAPFG